MANLFIHSLNRMFDEWMLDEYQKINSFIVSDFFFFGIASDNFIEICLSTGHMDFLSCFIFFSRVYIT